MPSRAKALIPICLAGIAIYSYVVRCLHLLDRGYYYVISADSYFFHWQARLLLEGESIPMRQHSGITYPIAYIAKAISFISGVSMDQSLRSASMFAPPLLAVVTVLLLYLVVSKMFDRRVALFSAFAWAVAPIPIFLQGAGYLDRDGLSLVLVMVGAFLFHRSIFWHVRVLGRDTGWLLAAAAVGGIEVLLYLEWVWLGPALLLAVVCFAWAAEVLFDTARRVGPSLWKPDLDVMAIPGYVADAILRALKDSNWRALSILLLANAVVAAKIGAMPMLDLLEGLVRPTASGLEAVELQGLTLGSLTAYNALLVTLLLGAAIGLKRMGRADSIAIGWFTGLLFAGLFISRLFLYAAPAVCVLSGVGLAYLFDVGGLRLSSLGASLALGDRNLLRYARITAGVILILLTIAFSLLSGYRGTSNPLIAADHNWQEALFYLRDNSDPDAVIMSHWDFGYYIRDLADRKPFVDNGIHYEDWDRDVALAYTATDVSEAVAVMQKNGASYLVFSTDYGILPLITKDAFGESYGDGQSIPVEMRNSLYARSLSGSFVSGDGLYRVYPDASVGKPRVVILALD